MNVSLGNLIDHVDADIARLATAGRLPGPGDNITRLAILRNAAPEQIASAYDSWLQVATGAQVRRHWRRWMGAFPAWAK